jgi:hypothetical protein
VPLYQKWIGEPCPEEQRPERLNRLYLEALERSQPRVKLLTADMYGIFAERFSSFNFVYLLRYMANIILHDATGHGNYERVC